jgi:two-component system CheB/CheR fusion protein
MDTVLQKKLLSVFYYALNPNGFLVLGQAETVGAQGALFSLVNKKYRVHSKKSAVPPAGLAFPIVRPSARTPANHPPPEPAAEEKQLQSEVSRVIMDRYAPPGVVVDNEMQIVQFRGQTGAFLEPAPGEASLNLLKMAKEGLLYGLRTALRTARKTRDTVHKDGLQFRVGKVWKPVSIEVIPLVGGGLFHYLVLFDDRPKGAASRKTQREPARPRLAKRERKTQIDFLQRELAASRDYLQSIIQELEAANEELQSANEEILSSNEELQSTNEELDTAKEELQSTNEELNTLNEELYGRNEELTRVNSDLINLLGSVQMAIVIVGADLRIRRFTPMAEKVLNLIPADIDRLIGHINPNILGANLEQLIGECMDSITPIEREVQDRQGHFFSLRIRPYRTVDNKIDGAVVTLYDIDAPKRYEESIRTAAALADALLHAASPPMALLDSELRLRSASPRFVELLLAGDHDRWQRRPIADFTRSDAGHDQLRQLANGDGDTAADHATLALQFPGFSAPVRFDARAFRHVDSASGRVVLLTAVVDPAAAAKA